MESRSPRIGLLLRQSFAAMTAQERARLIAMYGMIAGLHVAGFVIIWRYARIEERWNPANGPARPAAPRD